MRNPLQSLRIGVYGRLRLLPLLALPLLACGDNPSSGVSEKGLLTGYVEAELIYVAAPSSGWLISSSVQEGDSVTVRDLLFELESEFEMAQVEEASGRLQQSEAQARDLSTGARAEEIKALESQLIEAQAALDLAALEHRRLTTLAEQGIVAQDRADRAIAEFKAAKARVQTLETNIEVARLAGRKATREAASASVGSAQATLRQAGWRLDQRKVEARAAGRVEEIFHRPGEFVTAGSPVLALLPESHLEVRFFVPQDQLSLVEPGSIVEVQVDDPEPGQMRKISATVTYVARRAEFTPPVIYGSKSREKLVFLVRAKCADPSGLRPGQPVDVSLP